MSQVGFSKDDEVIEALMSDRSNEELSVRIAVLALGWDRGAGDVGAGKEQFPTTS